MSNSRTAGHQEGSPRGLSCRGEEGRGECKNNRQLCCCECLQPLSQRFTAVLTKAGPSDGAAWCPTDHIDFLRLELELWLWQDLLSGAPGHCCPSGCSSTLSHMGLELSLLCDPPMPPLPGPPLPSWAFVLP